MQHPKNMFEAYYLERESAFVVDTVNGFATYKLLPEQIYLQDIYVKPEFRMSGEGVFLLKKVEEIGRLANKTTILGSVDLSANNPEASLLAVLHTGFKVSSISGTVIYFSKPLEEVEK